MVVVWVLLIPLRLLILNAFALRASLEYNLKLFSVLFRAYTFFLDMCCLFLIFPLDKIAFECSSLQCPVHEGGNSKASRSQLFFKTLGVSGGEGAQQQWPPASVCALLNQEQRSEHG